MAESNAERQRRYKRHKRGDHGLCVPGRCKALTPRDGNGDGDEVTLGHPLPVGVTLGVPGLNLWREMTKAGPLPPMQAVLLVEACRITDRLEKLDRQLAGEDWLRFHHSIHDENEVVVVIDKALSEARQQATALKQLVGEIRQAQAPASSRGARRPSVNARPGGAGDNVADFLAAAARRTTPTG